MSKEISVSQFKAHCLEIISQLQTNQQSIVITKRHKPIAKIQSINDLSKAPIFGLLRNKAEIKGNIIDPINEIWHSEE